MASTALDPILGKPVAKPDLIRVSIAEVRGQVERGYVVIFDEKEEEER